MAECLKSNFLYGDVQSRLCGGKTDLFFKRIKRTNKESDICMEIVWRDRPEQQSAEPPAVCSVRGTGWWKMSHLGGGTVSSLWYWLYMHMGTCRELKFKYFNSHLSFIHLVFFNWNSRKSSAGTITYISTATFYCSIEILTTSTTYQLTIQLPQYLNCYLRLLQSLYFDCFSAFSPFHLFQVFRGKIFCSKHT